MKKVSLPWLYPSSYGARSAVSNVSDCRYVSDCRSRGHEFDPSPAPYFVEIDHETLSTVILLIPLILGGLLSVTSESICTNY